MAGSKRSHFSSSSDSMRTAWKLKKNPADERLMDLTNLKKKKKKKKNGDTVSTDKPIVCSAMGRAHNIQAKLSPHFPCFVKLMHMSHVADRFRLGLPKLFCDEHLPKQDGILFLLDENHKSYNGQYSADRNELTVGWRSFSTHNKLLEGDVLVFQLIEPCKFKVYIVKNTRFTQVDGPNYHFHRKPIEEDPIKTTLDEYLEHLSKRTERTTPIRKPARDEYAYYSDSFGTERSSDFKAIKGFKDFNMYVDDQILDSKIPTRCKEKYYELCKSRNMFLHENLIQGLNGKLAAGMISETIRIADAIKAVDSKTAPGLMEGWDKTLKGFEEIGMVVGFLRVRIRKLIRVFREYGADIELKRIERNEAEEERVALNVKLWRVENWIGKIDAEIDALSVKNESMGPVLKEIACAPW